MQKEDFKKTLKHLYAPRPGEFVKVHVPEMQFVQVDGTGNPNATPTYQTALNWLYSVSYVMKFASKINLKRDYVVPPLEGLWWADDPKAFVAREKDDWRWTMMIMVPDFVTGELFTSARAKAGKKLGRAPDSLRMDSFEEGLSLQALHVGSYDDEGPMLARLHDKVMPDLGVTFNGLHHEIYLGDPRKTDPPKLRTILRQPIKPIGS